MIDRILDLIGRKRRFYSSKHQDRWAIQRVFGETHKGYFVEVGAGDGRTHSNTIVMERDYGWTGVVIEANPAFGKALRKNRRCICVNTCINSTSDPCVYFCFGHLGGIVADDADNSWNNRASLLRKNEEKIIEVNCQTLEDILISVGAPKVIDFLSIDVEGAEYRVLKNFPFDTFKFEAITIERPTREIHVLLSDAGYVLDRIFRNDGFYVSKRRAGMIGINGISFSGLDRKPF